MSLNQWLVSLLSAVLRRGSCHKEYHVVATTGGFFMAVLVIIAGYDNIVASYLNVLSQ